MTSNRDFGRTSRRLKERFLAITEGLVAGPRSRQPKSRRQNTTSRRGFRIRFDRRNVVMTERNSLIAAQRQRHRLGAAVHAELRQDVLDVVAYGRR